MRWRGGEGARGREGEGKLAGGVLSILLIVGATLVTGCDRKPSDAPAGTGSASVSAPLFEVGPELDFRHRTGKTEALNIVQTSGGGCGMLDFDGDGLLDLFLVQGQRQGSPGGGNRLYRNLGGGRFEDVTEQAGVRGAGYGMGCATGDFNADGFTDLYLCNNGRNQLYQNLGNGRFKEVAQGLRATVGGLSVAAVFADLDGDRWPDLYVVRYVDLGGEPAGLCNQRGVATSCGPSSYAPLAGVFLHNNQGRGFVDQTEKLKLKNPGRGMAVAVADVNEDQRPDLLVTNDTTANALFLSSGARKPFTENALLAGVAYGEMGVAEGNMGCDWGDFNGDGRLDLLVGVMQGRSTLLFTNQGGGSFELVTRKAGIAEASASVVTWGCGFLDADLDGHLDFFQVNSHVQDQAEKLDPTWRYPQPRQLYMNDGRGSFQLLAGGGAALDEPRTSRGCAFGDLDNDGDIDVLVNNLDGAPLLLMNRAERQRRHWLRVRLEGKAPDLRAEGAELRLKVGGRTLLRHAHSAYSYASANDPRVHFGLGAEAAVGPLEVRWPDGTRQEVPVAGVDREIQVRQR